MKIVLFNWAPIWKGALTGGGVNGYLQALAPELVSMGHEVTSITSGLLYTDQQQGCFSRRHDDYRGVRVIEIINSPVLAPSSAQFREPLTEVSAPELEAEVTRLVGLLRPDVAHWHNLEGFSAGCVDACRTVGAKVVYSLHNYHTLCSQVTLCKGHEKPCHSFASGHACSTCIEAPDPDSERMRRCRDFMAEGSVRRESLSREHAEAFAQFKHEVSWPVRLVRKGLRVAKTRYDLRRLGSLDQGVHLPGTGTGRTDLLAAHSGVVKGERRVSLPVMDAARIDAEYAQRAGEPLGNIPTRDPSSHRQLGPHARRRASMIQMLNRCDRVLAVSDFVRLKYEAEGVMSDRIRTHRIGTASAAHAPPTPVRRVTGGPMRLVFLGFNHFNKGLPLLLAAMKGMRGDELRRIGLSIYAPGVQSVGPEFRRLCPPLAELTIRDSYQPEELRRILPGHDLCYVGSSWWDPLPQTVLESLAFGTPVLGAEAGGIPEVVRDGINGFLFRANDPQSLRRRLVDAMERFGTGDWFSVIEPPESIAAHALSLVSCYRALLGHPVHSGHCPNSENKRQNQTSDERSKAVDRLDQRTRDRFADATV